MASVEAGVLYGTTSIKLSSTSTTTILTVPSDGKGTSWEVTQIIIVDEDGTGGPATIYWYDVSGTTEYMLAYEAAVPSTGYYEFEGKPLHLEQGDQIRVAGEADQQVTVNYMVNDRSTAPFGS